MDAIYRRATGNAVIARTGRAAAMAHQVPSRYPVQIIDQTRILLRRVAMLDRTTAGLGLAIWPAARRRPAQLLIAKPAMAGFRTSLLDRPAAQEKLARRTGMRSAQAAGQRLPPMVRRQIATARPTGAALGAMPKPLMPARLGRRGLAPFADVRPSRLLPAGLARRQPGPASVGITGAGSRRAGAKDAPFAALALLRGENRRRSPGIAGKHVSARDRQHIATAMPQQTPAPGLHRTVRPPRSQSAAGDVYLDKALVGYHLAAAITAEQSRAAARPDISGASFNSSMAALRPSGAGL